VKLMLLSVLLLACDRAHPLPADDRIISVVDDEGRTIALARGARRVISLLPAATEIVTALDASDRLIGRTDEDSGYHLSRVASVGRVLNPSIERMVALQPDLVIVWADAHELLRRLAEAGIPAYAARFERLTTATSHIQRVGRLLGVPGRGDSLARAITSELHLISDRFAHAERPTVLYLLDIDPVWTAGANTFIDDLIGIAGGRNVFADLPSPWSEVALEAIVARQPDVIIVALPPARVRSNTWFQRAGWRELRAVQNNAVHFIDAEQVNRPGPSIITAARQLAELLHPEIH
jgi:ABC-type Fe3+-hydroxamate transport system substrate-binding protein